MVQPESIEIVEEEIAIDESEFACANLKQEMFEGDSENEIEGVEDSSSMLEEEPVTEDEFVEQEVDPEGMCFFSSKQIQIYNLRIIAAVFEEELVHEVQDEDTAEEEVILDESTFLSENIFCETVQEEDESGEVFVNEVTLEDGVNEVEV